MFRTVWDSSTWVTSSDRKLILTATGFLCLAGGTYFLGTSWGQDKKPPAEDVPHRVGLIDMGYVFRSKTHSDRHRFPLSGRGHLFPRNVLGPGQKTARRGCSAPCGTHRHGLRLQIENSF